MNRRGPGLLLRDLLREGDAGIAATWATIDALDADVLVLGGFDYDAGGAALAALNAGLAQPYPHLLALRPNTGIPTGFDLDGNGRRDEARDAQGYGRFPGEGGMAILSRLPVDPGAGRDHSGFLWRDLPENRMPPLPEGAADVLRLASTGQHDTALILPDGRRLHLLTWHAAPPAFGPLNMRRNHDETAFWLHHLDGPDAPPAPFVLIGQPNTDPDKGGGDKDAIRALLAHPGLTDALPGDTVDYGEAIGPLRVAYILPSTDLAVRGGGHAPAPEGARHHPIWLDLGLESRVD